MTVVAWPMEVSFRAARKFLLLVGCSMLLAACGTEEFADGPPAGSEQSTATFAPHREGELLVGYYSGDDLRAASAGPVLPGATVIERIEFPQPSAKAATVGKAGSGPTAAVIYHLRLPENTSVEEAIDLLRQDPRVAYAEPNYLVQKANLPNDHYLDHQWGLYNTGQTLAGVTGTAEADIQAPEAWELHTDTEVVVAVLDTGVDYLHPDLAANIWSNPGEIASNGIDDDGNKHIDDIRGWNFVANNNDPMDDDADGHGSHIAGIIGAVGDNGIGVAGIGWSASLMPLKFLDSTGGGDVATAVLAITYAVENGARIINASYTYPQRCIRTSANLAERDAIAAANEAGILFIAAAGNSGCNNDVTPFYPASHTLPNIVSVAATDPDDQRVSWSNYGRSAVHLGAPGLNIFSTIRYVLDEDGKVVKDYGYLSGTSMASPFVAGAAALIWSYRPELSHLQVKEALLATVDLVPDLATRAYSGGRLNLFGAMTMDFAAAPPPAPMHLFADLLSATQVELTWQTVAEAEGYRIERQQGAGEYLSIATVGASSSFIDSTVADGEHRYRLRTRSAGLFSDPSSSAEVFVPLRPPGNLTAVPRMSPSAAIELTWSDHSIGETGYAIERRGNGAGDFIPLTVVAANSTSLRDEDVAPGSHYSYRVRAIHDSAAPSDWSAEASAIIPAPSGSSSQCFIATAAFGSPWAPEVERLRRFRDRVLLPHPLGQRAVALYYTVSPPLARLIAGNEALRSASRRLLAPLVWLAGASEAQAMSRKVEPPPTAEVEEELPYVPGELLVRFTAGTGEAEAREIIDRQGAQIIVRLDRAGLYHLRLPPGKLVPQAAEEFAALPQVEYAEPNLRVRRGTGPAR